MSLQIQHTSPHRIKECYLKLTKIWLWKLTNQGRHLILVSIFLQEYCYHTLIFENQAKKKSIPTQSLRENCTQRLFPSLSPVIWGAWGCQPLYVISHNAFSSLRDGGKESFLKLAFWKESLRCSGQHYRQSATCNLIITLQGDQ